MMLKKKLLPVLVAIVLALALAWTWKASRPTGVGDGFVSGNGRIEAIEVDVATKMAGRVEEILVKEGDFVQAGQVLARMQIDTLTAQAHEAQAMHQQALTDVARAQAQVAARQSDRAAARAQVVQRESELDAARRRLARSETLAKTG